MPETKVTILVPHYKTLQLTKLCLRLIRKYTDLDLAEVIVIDNDSQDESVDYLRSINWIRLLQRQAIIGESPPSAHSRALDLALDLVKTPYVLSIHTDTLVKRADWLPFLLSHLEREPRAAGVGSWKLEAKPYWRQCLKIVERQVQRVYYRMTDQTQHELEGVGKNYYYLRSHCALYRTDLLRQYQLHFSDGDMVAGKAMHQQLVTQGHPMIFLPSEVLIPYLDHVNHATTVLNPELSSRQKSVDKGLKRIAKSLARLHAEEILQDSTLDRL